MKKKGMITYIILVLSLVVGVTAVTYAFLLFITTERDINTGSSMLGIDYVKPADLNGANLSLSPVSSREEGLKTSGSAAIQADSEDALFNMYITPTTISDSLKIGAFKWEAEGKRNGSVVCSGTGDFSGAVVGQKIAIIEGCALTTDITTFDIYIWLDYTDPSYGPVGMAEFTATIGADSVPITGGF